ncbi:MAG: acyltransferase family protein [Ilumatobacteraceae bacterium]
MRGAQVSTVATRPSAGYLPGLDGLRALSVTAVLLYHADLPWLPGGFLGVEVFFVISGYLITLLLTEEHARSSRISLRNFWLRRARRLLPAVYLLLATVAVVVLIFYRGEAANLAAQVWSALGYVTNWYFIFSEQSYFALVERPPVFQHLWSLVIEEQFYLVWPLALFGLLKVLGHNRRAMALVIFAGAALSTLWMAVLFEPAVDPSRPYYGTDTRASGLLLGAALALLWRPGTAWRQDDRQKVRALEAVGVAGVAVLVLCFFRMEEFDSFLYRGGFAVVGIASLLAIMSAVHPSTVLGRLILSNGVLTWIGVRSYSLYLWHWPIFVFTRPGLDQPLGLYPTLVLRLVLTVVAAELSYRFVEVPIRNGAFQRWRHRLAQRQGARRRTGPIALAGAAVLLLVAVSTVNAGPSAAEQQLIGQGNVPPPTSTTAPAIPDPPVRPASTLPTTTVPTPTTPGAAVTDASTSTTVAPTTTQPPTTTTPSTVVPPAPAGATITVLADSVLMGAEDQLITELTADGFQVDFRKQTAWQLDNAFRDLTGEGRPVGEVVVVGIGHDARWERDRANYDEYAQTFDEEADQLLAGLRTLGAERFVWVTLNESDRSNVPDFGLEMYEQYNWYFPYVNERLRLLVERHPDVVLADWMAVSNTEGLMYDAMHLLPDGIRLMIDTIRAGGNI